MPFSAVDAIAPAFEHTKRQLFQPFRLGQWIRLAFVGLLAGELSSGGGCNAPSIPNFGSGSGHPGPGHFPLPGLPGLDLALLGGLIVILVVAAFVVGILLMYVSSVMRFILFDGVVAKECHIRESWSRRQGPGWRYFLWKLVFAVASFGIIIVLVGIPAGFAFAVGWLRAPGEHVVPLVLAGIALFLVLVLFGIVTAVIYVLTKDFVIPQMALENIGAMEGWRRLWAMMKTEKGGYAGYVGMKIVLAIAAGILFGIVGLIFALLFFIPVIGIVAAAIFAGKSAGLAWTAGTITLAVVAGSVLLAVFLFVTSLISVPVAVFFPAYSMYFFAGRYPALSAVLYPIPPVPAAPVIRPESPPPYEPPPLPPAPAPAG